MFYVLGFVILLLLLLLLFLVCLFVFEGGRVVRWEWTGR